MITDWTELGKNVGSIQIDRSESGGDSFAIKALEEILGQEWIENTVEHIVSFKQGAELAMNRLKYIHSKNAVFYAYNIYKNSQGATAQQAVWLIKHIAHPISFDWIEEFLSDNNVMHLGIGVLDKLLWEEQISYDDKVEYLLKMAEAKLDRELQVVEFIREYLQKRNHST